MGACALLQRLRHDETGATALEYGLLLALIALAILGASTTIGDFVTSAYNTFGGTLSDVGTPNTGTGN